MAKSEGEKARRDFIRVWGCRKMMRGLGEEVE